MPVSEGDGLARLIPGVFWNCNGTTARPNLNCQEFSINFTAKKNSFFFFWIFFCRHLIGVHPLFAVRFFHVAIQNTPYTHKLNNAHTHAHVKRKQYIVVCWWACPTQTCPSHHGKLWWRRRWKLQFTTETEEQRSDHSCASGFGCTDTDWWKKLSSSYFLPFLSPSSLRKN